MISLSVKSDQVYIKFSGDNFRRILATLKEHKATYHPKTYEWSAAPILWDKISEQLEEIDVMEYSADFEDKLLDARNSKTELVLSSTRLMFDDSLLNYPPMKGLSPNEDYQRKDIVRAINRNRYGIFYDMGLGKSYVKAAIISHLRKYGKAFKVLLLSSSLGVFNLKNELLKFIKDLDEDDIRVMGKVEKDRGLFDTDHSIVITNYNTFRIICDHYYERKNKKKPPTKGYRKAVIPFDEWLGGKPGILLLDESHHIGNAKSQQTHRILQHSTFFNYRYIFTGTPADKPEKLYPQLRLLDASLVFDLPFYTWKEMYTTPGQSRWSIEWKVDELEKLNKKVTNNYAVYRETKDVLHLPENVEKRIFIDMDRKHRTIYESFVRSTLRSLQDNEKLIPRDLVNSFPYLQLALDAPQLLLAHERILPEELIKLVKTFDYKNHVKNDVLYSILEEEVKIKENKGIIWVNHPDTAHHLQRIYEKTYHPLVIIGETEEEERSKIIKSFKEGSHKLLIASIHILNTSITLTEASFQVYFERVYDYIKYSQSLKRIHRIGQDKHVRTYIPIFENSLDVYLDKLLKNKDTLNKKLLSKEFLTTEDIKEIFNARPDK
jgi:SNF2 family DNA or RNA helicase